MASPARTIVVAALALWSGACSLRSLDGLTGGEPPDPIVPPVDAAPGMMDASPADRPPADTAAAERPLPPPDAARPPDGPPPDAAIVTPDAAPDAPPGRRVLLIVANVPPMGPDALVQQRIAGLGHEVVPVDDDRLGSTDLMAAALIFVSETANTTTLGMRLRTVARPLIMCEPLQFDDLGLVSANPNSNRGSTNNVTAVQIDLPGHPLAAGLTGMVTISTAPGSVNWGMPANTALKVASVAGQATQFAIFAYEAGAQMAGLAAPARRVGLFLSQDLPATLSPAGWTLFDAAVTWAVGP